MMLWGAGREHARQEMRHAQLPSAPGLPQWHDHVGVLGPASTAPSACCGLGAMPPPPWWFARSLRARSTASNPRAACRDRLARRCQLASVCVAVLRVGKAGTSRVPACCQPAQAKGAQTPRALHLSR
eukprot:5247270-Karenia_brevis.AAC.1